MTLTDTQPLLTKTARILIVDDHPIVREGLKAVLSHQSDLEVCGEAASIAEALRLVDAERPDLAIIDLSLPDGSGLELLKQIKARSLPTKMLVLSMSEESFFAERALRAGASGFLHKQEARGRLIVAIHRILSGEIYVSETTNKRLLQQLSSGQPPADTSPLAILTNRELEVFEWLGKGLNTKEIAERLSLGVKTVETHRQNIRDKLNRTSSLDLVRYATQWTLSNSQG